MTKLEDLKVGQKFRLESGTRWMKARINVWWMGEKQRELVPVVGLESSIITFFPKDQMVEELEG